MNLKRFIAEKAYTKIVNVAVDRTDTDKDQQTGNYLESGFKVNMCLVENCRAA